MFESTFKIKRYESLVEFYGTIKITFKEYKFMREILLYLLI